MSFRFLKNKQRVFTCVFLTCIISYCYYFTAYTLLRIRFLPIEYAIVVSKENVIIHALSNASYPILKCKLNSDGNYDLFMYHALSTLFENRRGIELRYINKIQIAINDIIPGHHKIFFSGLMLAEFEWPPKNTTYIFYGNSQAQFASYDFIDICNYVKYPFDEE